MAVISHAKFQINVWMVGVNIPVDYSFQSCQNPVNSGSWYSLSTGAFRATNILSTLRVDIPVAFRATWPLKDVLLPVKYRSWQRSFSELTKFYQRRELTFLSTIAVEVTKILSWELKFLSTAAFRATKILSTLRADILVASRAT